MNSPHDDRATEEHDLFRRLREAQSLSSRPPLPRAEHIAILYRAGKGQRDISRLVGISQPAVRKRLVRLGLLPAADNHPAAPGRDNLRVARPAVAAAPCAAAGSPRQGQPPAPGAAGSRPVPLRQGDTLCHWCRGAFRAWKLGQRFCCTACGNRAQGLPQTVAHSEGCPCGRETQPPEQQVPY
jgi:hypothetical protein